MSSVLIIENGSPLARLAGWFLTESGHEVTTAESGDEAADAAQATHPAVVVFNTSAATSTKAECITRIRALSPDTQILDVSSPDHRPMEPPDSGADRYLQTPFHADTLVETVDALAASAA